MVVLCGVVSVRRASSVVMDVCVASSAMYVSMGSYCVVDVPPRE